MLQKKIEKNVLFYPGEILCSPPFHWKKPFWDSSHEMSSLLFAPDHIKITYIDCNGGDDYYESHPARIFYISPPLDPAGALLLECLTLMADSVEHSGAARLIEALLQMTMSILLRDPQVVIGKGERTWLRINQYIQNNFHSPINRAHVASVFNLHPSHLSRIFKNKGGESFCEKLLRLRLEHASELLAKTNLTIDEITDACGYSSTTYFIAAFKKRYGTTPGKYRINLTALSDCGK